MKRRSIRVFVRTTMAALLAIPFIMPFFFIVTVAIKPLEEYLKNPIGLPKTVTFEHLTDTWVRANLGPALLNSLFVSTIGVIVASMLCLSAAFWFFIHQSRRSARLRKIIMLGYAFPAVIWLIPLFVILARNNLNNKLIVLGFIYGVSNIPFGLYLVYNFYQQTLRTEIMEAATIDGATILQKFTRIAIPLALPVLSALATLVFVWSMGDILFSVTVLQDSAKWTLPIAAATLVSKQNISAQGQAAAAFVSMLPSLVIMVVAQRALMRGFGGGGSKG